MVERFGGQFQFPVLRAGNAFEAIGFLFFPVGEVADEIDVRGVRCPFPEHPLTRGAVQSEVEVSAGEFNEVTRSFGQSVNCFLCVVVPSFNGGSKRLQPAVIAQDSQLGLALSDGSFAGSSACGLFHGKRL